MCHGRCNYEKPLLAMFLTAEILILLIIVSPSSGYGIPYFARKYEIQCSTCHVIPPKLNQFGKNFREDGYRLPKHFETHDTVPFAVWMTQRGELQHSKDFEKAFPNRVEIIAAGPVGERMSYFIEWRAVSLETDSEGNLVDRSGRFEDLEFEVEITDSVDIGIGQYRILNQIDDSLKLGVSTPVVIGTSIPGKEAGRDRKTELRAFSPAARSPAVRLTHHSFAGVNSADGLFNTVTLVFPGEFSLPVTENARENASFEMGFNPKGVYFESFYRKGLSSVGANLFVDSGRSTGSILGVYNYGRFFSTMGVGYGRAQGDTSFRFSWENEIVPLSFFSMGARIDHRSDIDDGTAFIPNVNLQWPLTTYTIRLVLEQRVQAGSHATIAELSLVF